MKLAFVLSGHLRSFEITFPSFQRVREDLEKDYKVDVFIHTWDMLEPETPTYYNRPNFINRKITYKDIQIYNPVEWGIHNQFAPDYDKKILANQSLYGLICSERSKFLSKFYKSNYELSHGKYDVVICSRPDIYYYTNFPKEELVQTNKIWLGHVFHNKAACDILMFGGSDLIDETTKYNLEYKEILNKKSFPNNESYFLEWIKNNISFEWSKYCFPRDFKWIRSWWGQELDNPPEFAHDPYTCHTSFAKKIIEENTEYEYYRR